MMLIRGWGQWMSWTRLEFFMLTIFGSFFFFLNSKAICGVQCLYSAEWIFIWPCHFLFSDPASSQLDCFVVLQGRSGTETGTEVMVKKCGPLQWSLLWFGQRWDSFLWTGTERAMCLCWNVSTCWIPYSQLKHCHSGYQLNASGGVHSFCHFKILPFSHKADKIH